MLQNASVEIDNINATIRTAINTDRPKTLVSGAQELAFLEIFVREEFVLGRAQTFICLLE